MDESKPIVADLLILGKENEGLRTKRKGNLKMSKLSRMLLAGTTHIGSKSTPTTASRHQKSIHYSLM
jgi:hypothetical protein